MENSLTASQLRNESLLDDDVFNRSDSSDNLSRAYQETPSRRNPLTQSQLSTTNQMMQSQMSNQSQQPVIQINMEEFIQNKLRDMLEQPLIDMAKKEISLNAELKVLSEKELGLREKTNLLMAKLGVQYPPPSQTQPAGANTSVMQQ
eukprot:403374293